VIEDASFKTYGCGSAIASSSLVTEWVKGKTLDQALAIKNTAIAEELALPPVKIHCSILAEDAIKAAVSDYRVAPDAVAGQARRGRRLRRFLSTPPAPELQLTPAFKETPCPPANRKASVAACTPLPGAAASPCPRWPKAPRR
jgi:hypothetical protein